MSLELESRQKKSNHPWQNASNGSALAPALWELAWGCVLRHKSLWILVQYSYFGRTYLGAAVMSFNNIIFVAKLSNRPMDTDQHQEYSLAY